MEVYYIFPIGGLITAFLVAVAVGIFWIWNVATNNQTIVADFAAEHTASVIHILFIVSVILGLLFILFHVISYLLDDTDMEGPFSMSRIPTVALIPIKILEYILRLASCVIPIFLALSLCYGFLLDWAESVIRNLSTVVIVTILMSPVLIFLLIIYFIISLAPLLLLLITHLPSKWEDNVFVFVLSFLLAIGVGVVLTIGYHHFILNQTTLLTYLQ